VSPDGELLVDLAQSPWSLNLKRLLREGRIRREPHRLELEVPGGPSARAVLAWGYWLLDGASFSPGGQYFQLSSRSFPELKAVLRSDPGRKKLPAYAFLESAGVSRRLRIAPGPGGGAELRSGEIYVPLVQPEGEGTYYRRLEITETGDSRILPGRVIDEALDFADAVREFFKEGNAL
jgi:hypothetical protein